MEKEAEMTNGFKNTWNVRAHDYTAFFSLKYHVTHFS
jgi:hypothetical protein